MTGGTRPDQLGAASMAADFDVVPIAMDLVIDTQTPISVYMQLGCPSPGFVLDAAEVDPWTGRFSYVGIRSSVVLAPDMRLCGTDAQARLRGALRSCPPCLTDASTPLVGGLVGIFGPELSSGDTRDPASWVLSPQVVVEFDHLHNMCRLIAGVCGGVNGFRSRYDATVAMLEDLAAQLRSPGGRTRTAGWPEGGFGGAQTAGEVGRDSVITAIGRSPEEEIGAIGLAWRLAAVDPWTAFRALRSVAGGSSMYFLDFGGFVAAGNSVSPVVKVARGQVTMRDIAWVTPRADGAAAVGAKDPNDAEAATLTAKHETILSTYRQRLATVCDAKTLHRRPMTKEEHTRGAQVVSTVAGQLAPGCEAVDAVIVAGLTSAMITDCDWIIDPGSVIGYVGNASTAEVCRPEAVVAVEGDRATAQVTAGAFAGSAPDGLRDLISARAAYVAEALEVAGNASWEVPDYVAYEVNGLAARPLL